tara:strand:+ start:1697 stop:1906 length:210 start_codon:yes stop_codon:yes gene_type:complete
MSRITIGSLVRHRVLDAIGIVVEHTMWDADWGAYGVKFNKPVDCLTVNRLPYLLDRADRWVLISGCDNS